jgi:CheY-like chemotaxis protein
MSSVPDQGSLFWFEVPFSEVDAQAADPVTMHPPFSGGEPQVQEAASPLYRSRLSSPAHVPPQQASLDVPPGSGRHDTRTPNSRLRLLLVEDNAINQRVAHTLLTRLGHQVKAVLNGKEALSALALERFDAVLMDCQMPVMDGFEATLALRAGQWGVLQPAVPVIAMTANAMVGDRERCLEVGMNDYIAKPINVDALKAALNRLSCASFSTHSHTPQNSNE